MLSAIRGFSLDLSDHSEAMVPVTGPGMSTQYGSVFFHVVPFEISGALKNLPVCIHHIIKLSFFLNTWVQLK